MEKSGDVLSEISKKKKVHQEERTLSGKEANPEETYLNEIYTHQPL